MNPTEITLKCPWGVIPVSLRDIGADTKRTVALVKTLLSEQHGYQPSRVTLVSETNAEELSDDVLVDGVDLCLFLNDTVSVQLMSPRGLIELNVDRNDFGRKWTVDEIKEALHKQHGYEPSDVRLYQRYGLHAPVERLHVQVYFHNVFLTIGSSEHDTMRRLPFRHFLGCTTLDVAVSPAHRDELRAFPESEFLQRALADPRSATFPVPRSGVCLLQTRSSANQIRALHVCVQEFESSTEFDSTTTLANVLPRNTTHQTKLLQFHPSKVNRLAWSCPDTGRLLAEFLPTQPRHGAWQSLLQFKSTVVVMDLAGGSHVSQTDPFRTDPAWMADPSKDVHHIPGTMTQHTYAEDGSLASSTTTVIDQHTGFTFGGSLVDVRRVSKSGAQTKTVDHASGQDDSAVPVCKRRKL